jgi:DNA repair protein RAD16
VFILLYISARVSLHLGLQVCHLDLVLKSKTNPHFSADVVEATVCRLCNDIAEHAIESKCHHVFDRE